MKTVNEVNCRFYEAPDNCYNSVVAKSWFGLGRRVCCVVKGKPCKSAVLRTQIKEPQHRGKKVQGWKPDEARSILQRKPNKDPHTIRDYRDDLPATIIGNEPSFPMQISNKLVTFRHMENGKSVSVDSRIWIAANKKSFEAVLAVRGGDMGFFKNLMDGRRNIVEVTFAGHRVEAMMVRSIPGRDPSVGSWGLAFNPKILNTNWVMV